MRAALNDGLRWLLGRVIEALALVLAVRFRLAVARHARSQARLRRQLDIAPDTPILPYGADLERLIQARAARSGASARLALTSGSSAAPKRLLYTPSRLRATRLAFVDAYARACRAHRLRRRSLFVFSALDEDQSLTAALIAEGSGPSALAILQAPYRVLASPPIRQLAKEHGATAVRLLLLTVANPGVLYATNPSTLSTFLDDTARDWPRASALARACHHTPQAFSPDVRRILARLWSRGAGQRLAAVAGSDQALGLGRWAPGVEAYMTWTGGYVAPFLERLRIALPPDRYRLIPMFSMSTETIETVPCYAGAAEPAFLPLASGVLYEFLPAAAPDEPSALLGPGALEPGHAYSLVVSDRYGLRRYQTGDLFLCRGRRYGLPDLAFLQRRDLEHSFTGEKLTAQQATEAFARLRREHDLPDATYLSLVPTWPPSDPIPHYTLVVVPPHAAAPPADVAALARRCQALLEALNPEYRGKVHSHRLGPVRAQVLGAESFARQVGGERHGARWEAQFKFLPLYTSTRPSLLTDPPPAPATPAPGSPAPG